MQTCDTIPNQGIGITLMHVQTTDISTHRHMLTLHTQNTHVQTAKASLQTYPEDSLTVQIKRYLAVNVTPAVCDLSTKGQ